jgi:hypothetical protein
MKIQVINPFTQYSIAGTYWFQIWFSYCFPFVVPKKKKKHMIPKMVQRLTKMMGKSWKFHGNSLVFPRNWVVLRRNFVLPRDVIPFFSGRAAGSCLEGSLE